LEYFQILEVYEENLKMQEETVSLHWAKWDTQGPWKWAKKMPSWM